MAIGIKHIFVCILMFSLAAQAAPSCRYLFNEDRVESVSRLPVGINIQQQTSAARASSLVFVTAEKLPGGQWVKRTQEFFVDELSGAIDANFKSGRELFEKIAMAKAGRAHLAFVDVGNLGAINNTFQQGGRAGDRYLRSVAEKILKLGRGKITLARLGGDEFGLIIDTVDSVEVQKLLVQIQASLREDLKADAKQIFTEEKRQRAEKFREAAAQLKQANPDGRLTDQDIQLLRQDIDELAKIQQPDISIGSTQIGHLDDLNMLLERAEAQSKKMKISTALKFARSAEKYGSDEVPSQRPSPMFRAPIELPLVTASWGGPARNVETSPLINSLREIRYERKDEIFRNSNVTIARYEDELGNSQYRVEKYIEANQFSPKRLVTFELPTRGATELLDGVHPESQKIIMSTIQQSPDSVVLMVKLKSLRYLNYFEVGSHAGDEMLKETAAELKRHLKPGDLLFKLNGADFIWISNSRNQKQMEDLQSVMNQELTDSRVLHETIDAENKVLTKKLAEERTKGNQKAVAKLKEKLEALQAFNPNLQVRSALKPETQQAGSYKKILELLEQKFRQ